jgi:phage terminase large subunit-like protein
VVRNPWIPKTPWPHPINGKIGCGPFLKQRQFLLHAHTREVLFGGAAGGSKSWALLMAAAQYVEVPGYAALLLRSSFPDLMQPGALIPVSKEWWYQRDIDGRRAEWNSQSRRWTFPSGATITFGYLERDDDVFQYQGAAYQFIGFDEATQHTEARYRYLFSRLRRARSLDVPLRMRATANPGGRGHEWVKKRFITDPERGRVFIPSKMQDNPALDATDYIRSLSHLDPITRAQLLSGDWDAYAGGRFKREWIRKYVIDRDGMWHFGDKTYPPNLITGRFLTVDSAATVKTLAKDDPDSTAISAWGETPCGFLAWLGCRVVQCEIPDIAPHVAEMYAQHGARLAVVEGIGVGKGAAQLCKRHSARMNVVELKSVPDKLTNAAYAMNMAESGRLWLPANVPGFPLDEVEGQLFRFTGDPKKDSHDDIVDTLSVAANRVAPKARSGPMKIAGAVRSPF